MKRGVLVTLVLLGALVGVFFVVRDEPVRTVDTPLVVELPEEVVRVELVPAAGGAGAPEADLIVLEKGEGGWSMTSPFEAELEGGFVRLLEDGLSASWRADDFDLSVEEVEEYALGPDTKVGLSLFAAGAEEPSVVLDVGSQITVPGTGVRRTYVRVAGSDEVYRARVAMGDLVRTPLDEMRSKAVLDIDEGQVEAVEIAHPEGRVVRLERGDSSWSLSVDGEVREVDEARVRGALRAYTRLRAAGFVDDREALAEPTHEATIEADETYKLKVVRLDEEPVRYVAVGDRAFAWEIRARDGEALTAGPSYFEAPKDGGDEEP